MTNFNIRTHNGTITMTNNAKGTHRTIRIRTEKWSNQEKRVVSLKTPEGFKSFGFVHIGGGVVWKKFYNTKFETLMKMINNPAIWEEKGVSFLFEGTCRKCNRQLTHPGSIQSGIGPVCGGKQSEYKPTASLSDWFEKPTASQGMAMEAKIMGLG